MPLKSRKETGVCKTPKTEHYLQKNRPGGHLVQRGRARQTDHDEHEAETDAEDHI